MDVPSLLFSTSLLQPDLSASFSGLGKDYQLLELFENIGRLGAAALIGGIVGANRDLHHKPAGVRVLSMVALGSAAAMLVTLESTPIEGVSRTFQGILSGIGFLGAGVILRDHDGEEVHGITTSASIWMVAVLGAVCGLGRWITVVLVFGLTLLILTLGRQVEGWLQQRHKQAAQRTPEQVAQTKQPQE